MEYKMFTFQCGDKKFRALNGHFIKASLEEIRRGNKNYRIVEAQEIKRLKDKFNIFNLADDKAVTTLGSMIFISVHCLEDMSVPQDLSI